MVSSNMPLFLTRLMQWERLRRRSQSKKMVKVSNMRRKRGMEMQWMKKRNSQRYKLRSCFNLHTELFQTYLFPSLEQEQWRDGTLSIDLGH